MNEGDCRCAIQTEKNSCHIGVSAVCKPLYGSNVQSAYGRTYSHTAVHLHGALSGSVHFCHPSVRSSASSRSLSLMSCHNSRTASVSSAVMRCTRTLGLCRFPMPANRALMCSPHCACAQQEVKLPKQRSRRHLRGSQRALVVAPESLEVGL